MDREAALEERKRSDQMDIHERKPEERDAFLALWQKCFGDDPDTVQEFLDSFPGCRQYVLAEEGRIMAELTQFPMGDFISPGADGGTVRGPSCWCSYAICTDPAARGRGFGTMITEHAGDRARAAGALSVLCPADAGLVDFYKPMGFAPDFPACEVQLNLTLLDGKNGAADPRPFRLRKAGIRRYALLREELLEHTPHIDLTDDVLRYADLSGPAGQGLWEIVREDGETAGILALEETGDPAALMAVELLAGPGVDSGQLARSAGASYGAHSITFRTPVPEQGKLPTGSAGKCYVQGMTWGGSGFTGWYGFPFE